MDSARLNPRSLARFNLLILPGGRLPKGLASGKNLQFLLRWIEEGAVLIAIGSSAAALYRDVLKGKFPEQVANATGDRSWKSREERKGRALGAILEVELDPARS